MSYSARLKQLKSKLIGKLVGAYWSMGIATAMIAGAVSKGKPGPMIFGGLIIIGATSLLRSVRSDRKEIAKLEIGEQEQTLINLARARSGRITISEIVAETGIPFEEAKEQMERLVSIGACQKRNGDENLQVYYYPEFERIEAKRDAPTLEAKVLHCARQRLGRITTAELITETGLTLDVAQAELDRLSRAGECQLQLSDEGVLFYIFPTLVPQEVAARQPQEVHASSD